MKIGIIGLGLIGGSLFKDLNKKYDVIAVSQSQNGDKIFKTYDVLKDRDLIFVCTPMNKTLAVLDELENYLSAENVVTDVCSLKKFVSDAKRREKLTQLQNEYINFLEDLTKKYPLQFYHFYDFLGA